MFKEILDKYQLNPINCVFLDDMEDNTIAAETLDVKSFGREFFVNKILQNDIYKLH